MILLDLLGQCVNDLLQRLHMVGHLMVGIDIAIGCQLQNLPHRSGKHPQLPPGLLREKQRFDLQLLAGLYQVYGVVAQPLKVPDGVLHFPHAAAILLGKRLRRKVHQIGIQPVLIQIQRVLLLQYHLGVLLIVGADERDRPFQRISCRPGHPEGIVVTLLQRHRRGAEQQQVGRVYSSAYNGEVYLAVEGADNAQLPQRMSIPVIKSGSVGDEIPIGSGPYMYNEDRTALVKFDGYENSESLPLDEVQLRAYRGMEELITEFESGLVDLVVNDPTGIYNMGYGGKNEKRTITTTNLHFIGFNSQSRFFQYDAYRYAMNWIVNRNKIVSDTLDGNAVATVLPVHPNSALYDTSIASQFSYDPSRCLTELERGGCRDLDADGMLEFALSGMKVDIELNFAVCADNAAKVQEARRIAEDLEAIGIGVNLRELTWKDYLAALRSGYIDFDQEEPEIVMDMYLAEVALTGDWNILTLISGDWEDDNTLNYGGWDNSELEELTEAYLGAKDDDRAQAVNDWLQLLTTTTVILPVCFETREVISHLGVISGMSPNQYDVFNNITAWTVNIG